jgi:hypothetical protein
VYSCQQVQILTEGRGGMQLTSYSGLVAAIFPVLSL